jgi:hypothetical protein
MCQLHIYDVQDRAIQSLEMMQKITDDLVHGRAESTL